MREILNDIVRQSSSLFEIVKITGTDTETKIEAVEKGKTLFLNASLKEPADEFKGTFGISNLSLLNGLLNFASYKTEKAKFLVKRSNKAAVGETVTAFAFKDANGSGANYATMGAHLVGEQAVIKNIPWDVHVTPTKAKVAEFAQLASLYSDISKDFSVSVVDGDLVLGIGDNNEVSHSATLVFASDVEGTLSNNTMAFNSSQFFSILKMTGNNATKISITGKGVLGIKVDTDYGTYNYYLRGAKKN